MNIKMAIHLLKLRKYKNWDKYLKSVKKYAETPPEALSEKPTKSYKKAATEGLFSVLDMHKELAKKYSLIEIAGDGSSFEKALNIMQWLTDNTYYSGVTLNWCADSGLDILANSYGKGFEGAVSCRHKAIALADCLASVGLKAYPIAMMNGECSGVHFTVHFYCEEHKKWILLDPSFNSFFEYDSAPLSVWELRACFLRGVSPIIKNYSFNGTLECVDIYREYFVKQLLTNLSTWEDNSMRNRDAEKYDFSAWKTFETELPRRNE